MMETPYNQSDLLKEFSPHLERTSTLQMIWIVFLLGVIGLGGFALYTQISKGHIVTGMRDNVVWGIYIVNFIFFMGVSYAGALISGSLHLFRAEWRKPIIRMAEFITIIALLIGPCYILLCIGRLDRLPLPCALRQDPVANHLGRYRNFNRYLRMYHLPLPGPSPGHRTDQGL